MTCLVIILLILVGEVIPERTNNKGLLKLPAGEYRMDFKKMYNCRQTRDNKVHFNYYLTKKSDTSTQMQGNLTLAIPLDDNLSVDFNFAVPDSNGNWKNNTYIYQSEHAWTTIKSLLGKIDTSGLGFNLNFPLPEGVYIATGFNTSNFEKLNHIPKVFAYGTYRIRYTLKDKKKQHFGCLIIIVEAKRP